MTVEQRTFIELGDVVAVELGCSTCGSRIRYPLLKMQPAQFKSRQHYCPNCKDGLLEPYADGPEVNRIAELAEALLILIKSKSRAIIRLEIAGPK